MALFYSFRRLAGLAAIAMLAAACASGDATASDGVAEPAAATTTTARPAASDPAPVLDISLATVDGGQLEWNSLAGQDVMLWFWAPW